MPRFIRINDEEYPCNTDAQLERCARRLAKAGIACTPVMNGKGAKAKQVAGLTIYAEGMEPELGCAPGETADDPEGFEEPPMRGVLGRAGGRFVITVAEERGVPRCPPVPRVAPVRRVGSRGDLSEAETKRLLKQARR